METGLTGRTVIVTGGNANIGRGIVLAFAAEAANVVVVARDEEQGRAVCEEARNGGAADAFWYRADVTERAEVDAMLSAVIDRYGMVDVLVNNVGGNVAFSWFVDSDPATWAQDIALNMTSTLNCTHAVLPGMVQRGSGRIINIGSTAGIVGDPMLAVYTAMKGGVHAFTRVLAREVGPSGITVNAVAPYGTVPEDFERETSTGSRWHPDGVIRQAAATVPEMGTLGRRTALERSFAKPAEIGAATVYLASDAAAFVTGQVLSVEGGAVIA